jgi:hypothetical protein
LDAIGVLIGFVSSMSVLAIKEEHITLFSHFDGQSNEPISNHVA